MIRTQGTERDAGLIRPKESSPSAQEADSTTDSQEEFSTQRNTCLYLNISSKTT